MDNLDNKYSLPRDVVNNNFICQIVGRNEILIDNIRKIIYLSTEEISICGHKGGINIKGCNLNIVYYNNQSIIIRGGINEIMFL